MNTRPKYLHWQTVSKLEICEPSASNYFDKELCRQVAVAINSPSIGTPRIE